MPNLLKEMEEWDLSEETKWIWAVAKRYAPGAARPILVELGTAGREGAPCIPGPETRVRSRSPRRITPQPLGDKAGSTIQPPGWDIIPHNMGTLSTRHRVVWQGQTTRQRQDTEEIVRSLLLCVLAHVGCDAPPLGDS